jgi:hypothetical protein
MLKTLLNDTLHAYQTTDNIHGINTPECIFDVLFSKIRNFHEQPAHSITELRLYKTTKSKGDLFEELCKLYLLHILQYDDVWLLQEVPEQVKRELKMPFGSGDYGIDIICKKENKYSAVQCKFKTPKNPVRVANKKGEIKIIYPCVGWKELSTFNELCNSTGPWCERIVMTTAKSVRRLGGLKKKGDKSICLGSFRKLEIKDIQNMITNKEEEKKEEKKELTIEELRKRRLEYYKQI